MSSLPHPDGHRVPHPTHSGNGDIFRTRLSAVMANSADGHTPDDQEAIGILASQLQTTHRQSEVLHWIAEGKTNGEIATILGCSVNTVKMHLKDIFQRLGVHTRTAAAAAAYRAHIRHAKQNSGLPERVIPEKPRAR